MMTKRTLPALLNLPSLSGLASCTRMPALPDIYPVLSLWTSLFSFFLVSLWFLPSLSVLVSSIYLFFCSVEA